MSRAHLVRGPARAAALACLAALVGCSSPVDPSLTAGRGPAAEPEPGVSAPATAGRRAARPVPDVVSRPQPIRLTPPAPGVSPDVAGGAAPVALAPQLVAVPAAPEPSAAVPRDASGPAVEEIRAMLRSYLRAFNQHDAPAVAAHWSEAGESVGLDTGDVTSGREAVRDVFAALFAEDDAATIDIDVESIRPIRDDVAVVDGVTRVAFADGLPAGSRFSAVVVREGGRWLLDSVREAARPEEAAAAARPLDDLAWLVGTWEDTGAGVNAGTQCFWSAGRGFLVRTHAVRADAAAEPAAVAARASVPGLLPPGDASARELTEIIGWDADRGAIRSWLFTSSGRFAEATWSRGAGDKAWTIRVEGRGRDEGATCTCTLAADGADGLALTCDSDALAGLLPPACGFVRTARLGSPAAE